MNYGLKNPRSAMDCHRCGSALPSVRHYKTYLCTSCKALLHGNGRKIAGYDAQRILNFAVRIGFLPRISTCKCVDCGAPATDYDHRDYNRPLDVDPVCRSCNFKRGPAKPFVQAAA